jgi:hypothetical protein
MVDAADLKSAVAKATYGFESRPRHGNIDDSSEIPDNLGSAVAVVGPKRVLCDSAKVRADSYRR